METLQEVLYYYIRAFLGALQWLRLIPPEGVNSILWRGWRVLVWPGCEVSGFSTIKIEDSGRTLFDIGVIKPIDDAVNGFFRLIQSIDVAVIAAFLLAIAVDCHAISVLSG